MEPRAIFAPFGSGAPQVALFGKDTGDWSPSCFQPGTTYLTNPGLYFRFNCLAQKYQLRNIFIPSPSEFNTKVCKPSDFTTDIQEVGRVVLKRGARVDGVILERSQNGAIASADCPTIVAYCPVMRRTIIAHAGCKSIVHVGSVLGDEPQREYPSVVDSLMVQARKHGFRDIKVFVTCGVSAVNYRYPELVEFVSSKFGEDCVVNNGLDLKKIVARQFSKYGINDVLTDTLCTYSEKNDVTGDFSWHSYRRGKTPEEKASRNLVLVINQ